MTTAHYIISLSTLAPTCRVHLSLKLKTQLFVQRECRMSKHVPHLRVCTCYNYDKLFPHRKFGWQVLIYNNIAYMYFTFEL